MGIKDHKLRGKRVLITAGPTWVPIDSVRVISNTATGETGILLAKEAARLGAKVTLVLGPVAACCPDSKLRLIRFRFFDDLRASIRHLLTRERFDYIVHCAAVSDFKPVRYARGKIDSDKGCLLRLKPLPKIINDIRALSRGATLVMFKLEAGVPDALLLKRALVAQKKAGADIVVANRLNPYRAFVIDTKGNRVMAENKKDLARALLAHI